MTTYEQVNTIIGSLNLVASYGGLALIHHGIRVMSKNTDMRSADSERKHGEVMTESERRHEEAMRKHDEAITESMRRHDEAMAESRRREQEGIRRHEESMAALRELIDGQSESRMALRALIERTR